MNLPTFPFGSSRNFSLEFSSKWFTLNSVPLAHHGYLPHASHNSRKQLVGSNSSNIRFNTFGDTRHQYVVTQHLYCYVTQPTLVRSANTKVYWYSEPTKLYSTYTNNHSTCTIFHLFSAPLVFHSTCTDYSARLGRHFSYFIFFHS